ncbi:MAG: hypothetical protein M3Y21_12585 [Candidatus Eremiobacteraeota bacterium]|nr:hypothetical protein [Candidatus Eremiobacteraeota bacterium]
MIALLYSLTAHAGHPETAKFNAQSYRASAPVVFTLVSNQPAKECSKHAAGAYAIARRYADKSGGTVSALGPTRGKALQILANSIAAYAHSTNTGLRREEALYERVTSHGAAQDQARLYGFPSGASCGTRRGTSR